MRDKQAIANVIKYTLTAVFIFALSITVSVATNILFLKLGFTEEFGDSVSNMIDGVIAAIAAGLVLYQLKLTRETEEHQSDIEEATFILQYNQSFIQDPNMAYVETLLEKQTFYGNTEQMITDENREKFINYLVYLEGIAPLILRGVFHLEHIDDLMAYRFFLIVNNREVQNDQLKAFPEYYRGCFKVYRKWVKFRKDHNREVLSEENGLDKWEEFEKYAR